MNEGSRSYARQISCWVSQAADQSRKNESRLKKFISIPRSNPEKERIALVLALALLSAWTRTEVVNLTGCPDSFPHPQIGARAEPDFG